METLLIVLIVGIIMAVLVGLLVFMLFYKQKKFTFPDNNNNKTYNPLPLKGNVTIIGKTNYPLENMQDSQFIYNNTGGRLNVVNRKDDGTLVFQDALNPNANDITKFTIYTTEGTTWIWQVYTGQSKFPITYTIQKEDIGQTLVLTDDGIIPQSLIGTLQITPESNTLSIGAMPLLFDNNLLPSRITERCWCNTTFTNCTSDGVNASNNPICTGPKIAWNGQKWLISTDGWKSSVIITLQGNPIGGKYTILNSVSPKQVL